MREWLLRQHRMIIVILFMAILIGVTSTVGMTNVFSKHDAAHLSSIEENKKELKSNVVVLQDAMIGQQNLAAIKVQSQPVVQSQIQTEEQKKEDLNIITDMSNVLNLDLRREVDVSKDDLTQVLINTRLHGLESAFIDEAEKNHINVIFLVAVSAEESGWGSSYRARVRNNIFGIETKRVYRSKSECTACAASLLANQYLKSDGQFYHGETLYDVNINWNPPTANSKGWSHRIANLMLEIKDTIENYRVSKAQ